jgi:NAD(P)-dependent dehydrogenase (short-subunit alcohol dehydrogenase family)
MRLQDRTAIVTGAASGIGRAIARRFAGEGARVIIADVRADPIEGGKPTHDLITAKGGEARFVKADVAIWEDVERLVQDTVAQYGRLDIMVNNAATYAGKPLIETSDAEWATVIGVNITGVFHGCKAAVRQMLTQSPLPGEEARGRIVNISSQHGMICAPGDFAYGVGKAGVVYMTRQIAVDYADQGIVCNAVAPGKIQTGAAGLAADPGRLAYAKARTPWPRLGRPEDVASAALFLAGAEATYITGINLMVDGGWSAG